MVVYLQNCWVTDDCLAAPNGPKTYTSLLRWTEPNNRDSKNDFCRFQIHTLLAKSLGYLSVAFDKAVAIISAQGESTGPLSSTSAPWHLNVPGVEWRSSLYSLQIYLPIYGSNTCCEVCCSVKLSHVSVRLSKKYWSTEQQDGRI